MASPRSTVFLLESQGALCIEGFAPSDFGKWFRALVAVHRLTPSGITTLVMFQSVSCIAVSTLLASCAYSFRVSTMKGYFKNALIDLCQLGSELQLPLKYMDANMKGPLSVEIDDRGMTWIIDGSNRVSTRKDLHNIGPLKRKDPSNGVSYVIPSDTLPSISFSFRSKPTRPEVWYIHGRDLDSIENYVLKKYGRRVFRLGVDSLDYYSKQDVCLYKFTPLSNYITLFEMYMTGLKFNSSIIVDKKKYSFNFNVVVFYSYNDLETTYKDYILVHKDYFSYRPIALLVDHNVEWEIGDMSKEDKGTIVSL